MTSQYAHTSISNEDTVADVQLILCSSQNYLSTCAKLTRKLRMQENVLIRDFSGKEGESITLYAKDRTYCLIGLGNEPTLSQLRMGIRRFVYQYRSKIATCSVDLKGFTHPFSRRIFEACQTIAEGFRLGLYELGTYKTADKKVSSLIECTILVPKTQIEKAQLGVEKGEILAAAQCYEMELIDSPANYLTPKIFAKSMRQSAKKYGYKAEVFELKDIEKMGMGGLVAVGQGSKHPATFTILEHKPKHAVAKVAFIGKGVTFDTGGVSIKPADNMMWMKCDMGGAAIVAATVEAAARLELPIHVIGAVPSTENKLGDNAYLPSDVLTMYNGKTVEVEDTDAEGRLILADALAYVAKNHKPDVLIDLATLTGSCVTALGYHAAGLFTSNDTLAKNLTDSGVKSENNVWRLPIWDVYSKQIQSDVADIRNLGGRAAGAITAAKFLEAFTDQHPSWAHLDVAGVVFGDDEFGKMRHASGWGVHLLIDFLMRLTGK
jgi:leucyl aminopeptidase